MLCPLHYMIPGFPTATSTAGGLFGQTSQPAAGGLFGQNKPAFGTTATTGGSAFTFGAGTGATSGGLFGQTTQNKVVFCVEH